MDFKEYIAKHKQLVYSTICDYVQIKEPKAHYSIMRDYIDRQGSYRRPGLILLTGQMFNVPVEQLLLPASAMQLSEDWILMQDDIEDDSELRRGKPAAHKLYGWVHTLNATNVGQIAMWRMLKDYMLKFGMDNGNKIYEKFYDMLSYTMEGQYIENNFIYDIKNLSKVSEDFYFKVVDSKTCYYTVYGPLQIGAIAANQPASTLEVLKEIGTPGGISFQITDDILDIIADEKVFGKKNFGDLYEGKVTLIMLNTYKNATSSEKEKIDSIYTKPRKAKTLEEINFLLDLIKKYDSIEYAKEVAKKYGEMSRIAVEKNVDKLPNNEYTTMLLSSIKDLYSRNK